MYTVPVQDLLNKKMIKCNIKRASSLSVLCWHCLIFDSLELILFYVSRIHTCIGNNKCKTTQSTKSSQYHNETYFFIVRFFVKR